MNTKRKRTRVNTTVDPELRELAEKKGIKLSTAIDVGLRQILSPYLQGEIPTEIQPKSMKEQLILHDQQRQFSNELVKSIKGLSLMYNESETMDNPFIEHKILAEKINKLGIKLDIPLESIEFLVKGFALDTINDDKLLTITKEDMYKLYEKIRESEE